MIRRLSIVPLCAVAITFHPATGSVYSQDAKPVAAAVKQYASIPMPESMKSSKTDKEMERAKDDVIKGNVPFNMQPIRSFYGAYQFPRLTSIENPLLANRARTEINTDIVDARRKLSPANLATFNSEILRMFSVVIAGDYAPHAVINCVLLAGELDSATDSSSAVPKPYSQAVRLLNDAALQSPSDGVRAAALVGLQRHLLLSSYEWNENTRNGLAKMLLDAAKAAKPNTRSEEAHGWLIARYMQLLMSFEHSLNADLATFATDTLANEHTHPILREQALRTLGKLDPVDAPEGKLVNAGRYSMRYLKKRCEQWNELFDLSASSTGGGGGSSYGNDAYGSDYGKDAGPGDSYGGTGGGYGAAPKPKEKKEESPFEKHDAQTKMLRRYMHELVQTMRTGMVASPIGELNERPEKGLLAKLPDGEEREIILEALEAMVELQTELDATTITGKNDLAKTVKILVDRLIVIAEDYPGALDLENELMIEDSSTAPVELVVNGEEEDADGVKNEAAVGANPTRGVKPVAPVR